jgi:hypothetical protein
VIFSTECRGRLVSQENKAPLGEGLSRCCWLDWSQRCRCRRNVWDAAGSPSGSVGASVRSISRSGAVNRLCRGQPARPALQNKRLLTRHAPDDGQNPHRLAAHGTEEVFVAELHWWPSERERGATVIHIKLLGARQTNRWREMFLDTARCRCRTWRDCSLFVSAHRTLPVCGITRCSCAQARHLILTRRPARAQAGTDHACDRAGPALLPARGTGLSLWHGPNPFSSSGVGASSVPTPSPRRRRCANSNLALDHPIQRPRCWAGIRWGGAWGYAGRRSKQGGTLSTSSE